jgi:hypothetical protein
MASTSILTQGTPAANTALTYTVTAAKKGLVDINACNKGTTVANLKIAIITGGTTTYLEWQTPLAGAGSGLNSFERTGRKYPAGTVVSVQSDSASVDWTIEALEE